MGSEQAQYPNVIRAVLSTPWAIDPDSLAWAAIVDVLALRAAGHGLSDDEIQARIAAAQNGPRQGRSRGGSVAVIPVYGVISPRQSLMAQTSGGTSAEAIAANFREMLGNPDVDSIVFDIDSPGGVVEGMEELTSEIRAARGQKPVVAVANHTAASAAFWFASAADEIVATPSAMVGAIGVFTAHDDLSEAMAQAGVKRTVISAGKHKAEGALGTPLSDEARAHVQGQVDQFYGLMTSSIAKSRGIEAKVVRGETFGQGRGVLAKDALAAGMVDRIDTLDNTIRRVARSSAGRGTRAQSETSLVALASGLPFTERLALVLAEAEGLAEHSHERAALRAEEGRRLSAADRRRLTELGDSLRALAGEPDESGESAPPTSDWRRRARVALELARAEFDLELTGATTNG